MDQENLKSNDSLLALKTQLLKIKTYKEKLQEAYADKTTNYLQKNEAFKSIISEYRTCMDEIKRIVDEDLPNVSSSEIPISLIEYIDKNMKPHAFMEEQKQELKKFIDNEKEKQANLSVLESTFKAELISTKILSEE